MEAMIAEVTGEVTSRVGATIEEGIEGVPEGMHPIESETAVERMGQGAWTECCNYDPIRNLLSGPCQDVRGHGMASLEYGSIHVFGEV